MKYFGTDGIRNKEEFFFKDNLAIKVGMGLHSVININKVVIAMDTRLSGPKIKHDLIKGLSTKNIEIYDLGIVPTPALAYLTLKIGAEVGIMISASHNPPEYNGIKIFDEKGYKLSEEDELKLENVIDKLIVEDNINIINPINVDAKQEFTDYLISRLDVSLDGYKIKLDCGYGASSHLAKRVFERLGAKVDSICDEYKGEYINVDCGSTNINNLAISKDYDIGFSFDGDADRVIAVDSDNNIIDGDAFLYIISKYLKKHNRLEKDTVVGTIMTNMALCDKLKDDDIELIRVNVGDKYIQQSMIKNGYVLGGEQSGHIILDGLVKTGDGIFSGCMLLQALKDLSIKTNDIKSIYIPYEQTIENIITEDKECIKAKNVKEAIFKAEELLKECGRINVRASGTEPKIRIMVESKKPELVNKAIEIVKKEILKTIK